MRLFTCLSKERDHADTCIWADRSVTEEPDAPGAMSLLGLGWSAFFADQLAPQDAAQAPVRVAAVHRARLGGLTPSGSVDLILPVHAKTGDFTVGDWVMADPETRMVSRRLVRRTVLSRHTDTGRTPQLAGANIDTLFIVTSCNADFNLARLERYLALANQADIDPVLLLTKADMSADHAETFQAQASGLQRGLPVVTLNPRKGEAVSALAPWCGVGRTVALVGSSGVGKSTLVNTLVGSAQALPQQTGAIREHDAKGRHTTTSRSLHAIAGGGWVIDTPGMRTLQMSQAADGIDTLFAEITELAPLCRFRDCTHAHEPGCAVRAAVVAGTLQPERLTRWRKLRNENNGNSGEQAGPRGGRAVVTRSRKR